MASAIARPAFSLQLVRSSSLSSSSSSSSSGTSSIASKSHLILKMPLISIFSSSPSSRRRRRRRRWRLQFFSVVSSIDVSKEDKPSSEEEPNSTAAAAAAAAASEVVAVDKRSRPEERFAVLNTGIYDCRSCGYLYDEALGDPSYPIAPGLPFDKLPEDWRCPTCGAAKSFFQSKSIEIAGFAQNQQFGLGTNSLTSAQKLILIYGSLAFFFALFLGGYFLQ
ncbi:hypothetical protein Sjap_007131 [Stephania japonica]|uniref:Rubredoxin-like domain-containing protein n=1 Tax=Stephania japonica TaxID=461633 RepID=A0AAP0PA54_9MAGN